MRVIILLFTFYKSFAFASLLITLSCLSIIYKWGIGTFTALFWFKVITDGLILYYFQNFKDNNFYYYKNLGVEKRVLWASSLTFDFVIFLVLVMIVIKIG